MIDPLRLHVLYSGASGSSRALAELLDHHIADVPRHGGEPLGIPIRFHFDPLLPDGSVPTIDLDAARRNVIVFLHDRHIERERVLWDRFAGHTLHAAYMRKSGDLFLPFSDPEGSAMLPALSALHHVRRERWPGRKTNETLESRFLLHVFARIRETVRKAITGKSQDSSLFVSYASSDGKAVAESISDFLRNSTQDVNLPVFTDTVSLRPGEDFADRFRREISDGILLAIATDAYDSRPWCNWEMSLAKEARVPIVVADLLQERVSRSYPYGSNVPRVRVTARTGSHQWMADVVMALLAESIRSDVFRLRVQETLPSSGSGIREIVIRLPELLDLAHIENDGDITLVYPNPPLPKSETELFERVLSHSRRAVTLVALEDL